MVSRREWLGMTLGAGYRTGKLDLRGIKDAAMARVADRPVRPAAAAEPAAQEHQELNQAIQQPLDRARAVEGQLEEQQAEHERHHDLREDRVNQQNVRPAPGVP